MNIDITDYRYDEDNHQLFMKRVLDAHEYELPFSQESDGTKNLFLLFRSFCLRFRKVA